MEIRRARYSSKPTRKRSKKPHLLVVLVLIISFFSYSYAAISKPIQPIQPTLYTVSSSIAADVSLPWASGQGVLGTLKRGAIASSSDQQSIMPIASMTKLITALAVLEKQPLQQGEQGQLFTITGEDIDIYYDYVSRYGSIMAVRQGQQVSQYQALQGLLLPSANNIADLLAREIFGSEGDYVSYANDMIKRFGLKNTTVDDASGFSPRTVSTPSDMFEIGIRALNNPVIAEVSAQREAFVPGSGTIRNTNMLLADESVVGLKTGMTDEAGSCLMFAFEVTHEDGTDDMVVGVIMGVPTWPQLYREVKQLIYEAKQNFIPVEVMPSGTIIGEYRAPWGDVADIVTADKLIDYEWAGLSVSPRIVVEGIKLPLVEGASVGQASTDDARVNLVVDGNIDEPSIWWRLTNLR